MAVVVVLAVVMVLVVVVVVVAAAAAAAVVAVVVVVFFAPADVLLHYFHVRGPVHIHHHHTPLLILSPTGASCAMRRTLRAARPASSAASHVVRRGTVRYGVVVCVCRVGV